MRSPRSLSSPDPPALNPGSGQRSHKKDRRGSGSSHERPASFPEEPSSCGRRKKSIMKVDSFVATRILFRSAEKDCGIFCSEELEVLSERWRFVTGDSFWRAETMIL
ncbi:hypothetical protein CEXT_804181 [Caerostris extrusa]|uniref:Uncharacterized protein n=1 Tax=Caerostris extrusa TaxID=172846 RepID=A0AAV4N4V9_CAEEX|nr:hypothetical protein CEXT_804181 [Caerostris extrusa]